MRKFFYAAIAAVALMVVSCAQKTPAEEALANFKETIEKMNTFDGTEDDLMVLMLEAQNAEQEYLKYVNEYSQETKAEMEKLYTEAANNIFEKMVSLKGGLTDGMEDIAGDIEEEIGDITDDIIED